MVLQDHFHPPLSLGRHWHSFHNAWATYIASDLNSKLPEDYFAEINVQFKIKPIIQTVEINIFNTEAGVVLAGAIELVSPANKDRASHRKAFVSKCETLLRQGIGLVIVDVVTERKANLHDELLNRITEGTSNLGAPERLQLYATSYRVIERSGQPSIDIWQEKINVGDTLPTVPFWLRGNNCLPLELDNIYKRTCQEQRIYAGSA
ncbi:hypothetical protein DSM106972_013140 [Dulcicalothrix desertica PCC 7102]|uniref:DUF4058 domain-containing protein n=1 Tax=Dulcicalothrix desertica PCC 7102 TaxID=232991 RepID=A0A3S1ASL1_9CYAN|nr:DUF4058 family protein [Dulcicalothrix desertica]RUT08146.1 hypothetical protein DSM106972_013140 [Dulcicalothrix desertica PCC 7102]TWH40016.1 uncharacterized protein DUF4058 [Dulcicalothrix desertica PCC 7102]